MSELAINYTNTIVLIVPSSSWKISIPLQCRALTTTKILAFCPIPPSESTLTLQDIQEFLQSGEPLEVQIQHDYDHLDIPVLEVTTSNLNPASHGIEIIFQINKMINEYDDLMAELSEA